MIDKSESIDTYLDQIRLALEEKNTARAVSIFVELYPADQAEIFNYLTEDELVARRNGRFPPGINHWSPWIYYCNGMRG